MRIDANYYVVPKRVLIQGQKIIIWRLKLANMLHIFYASEVRSDVINYFKEKIDHFSSLTKLTVFNEENKPIRRIIPVVDMHAQVSFSERIIDNDFQKLTKTKATYKITYHKVFHNKNRELNDMHYSLFRTGWPFAIFSANDQEEVVERYKEVALATRKPTKALIFNEEGSLSRIILGEFASNYKMTFLNRFFDDKTYDEYYINFEWSNENRGVNEKIWGIKKPGHSNYVFTSKNKIDVEKYFRNNLNNLENLSVAYVVGNDGKFEKIIRTHIDMSLNEKKIIFEEQKILDQSEVTREIILNTSTKPIRIIIFIFFIALMELITFIGLKIGGFI